MIIIYCTPWLFNIAMENCPFIDDFPIETSIYEGFSMAMLNNQMVIHWSSGGALLLNTPIVSSHLARKRWRKSSGNAMD